MVAPVTPVVRVFPDLAAAAGALAEQIVTTASEGLRARGRFGLALSGGSTPVALFRTLLNDHPTAVPWDHVDYFWADERAVGPDDPLSNYGLAARGLLDPLSVPMARRHRIVGEASSLDREADRYAADLRTWDRKRGPEAPAIDLVVLGLGADGHTASLFPGSPRLDAPVSVWVEVEPNPGLEPHVPRVTMTLPGLARARSIAFLVAGPEKRDALARVLRPEAGAGPLPAARVRCPGPITWYVDRAARGPGAENPDRPG